METGVLVLIGVFAFAALCALWKVRARRSAGSRLAALGFEPCEAEAPALAAAWQALCAATGARREVRVSGCLRRAAGWGMLHYFDLTDVTNHQIDHVREGASVGASFSVYLLDLREPASVHRAPVALWLMKPGARVLRALIRRVIELDPPGAPLEVGPRPWAEAILGAYGATPGKLDEAVPAAAQEKIARVAEHGFFQVRLAGGKAAFGVLPGRRDVEREWACLAEWV